MCNILLCRENGIFHHEEINLLDLLLKSLLGSLYEALFHRNVLNYIEAFLVYEYTSVYSFFINLHNFLYSIPSKVQFGNT